MDGTMRRGVGASSRLRLGAAVAVGLVGCLAAGHARSACCDVSKVDTEIATTTVRVCEPDASDGCGNLLFVGPLSIGDSQNVCTGGPTIVYEEWDDQASVFGPPTVAVCDGGPVEI